MYYIYLSYLSNYLFFITGQNYSDEERASLRESLRASSTSASMSSLSTPPFFPTSTTKGQQQQQQQQQQQVKLLQS
jgi:hypothetical protein